MCFCLFDFYFLHIFFSGGMVYESIRMDTLSIPKEPEDAIEEVDEDELTIQDDDLSLEEEPPEAKKKDSIEQRSRKATQDDMEFDKFLDIMEIF